MPFIVFFMLISQISQIFFVNENLYDFFKIKLSNIANID